MASGSGTGSQECLIDTQYSAWHQLRQHHDYVFCTKLGRHLTPTYVVATFKSLLKEAGLPDIRFHDVRHTAATTLLALGVNPKIVQEMLGHTEISMTMDIYSHVLPTMQKETIQKMNSALWG